MSQVTTGEVEWRCIHCGFANWSDHRMCTKCEKWRDQDWSCVMCGYKNFAKRDTCNECGAGKVPEAVPDQYTQEAGAYQNYQVQISGYQDPYSVPQNQVPPVPEVQELGLELPWLCGMCNTENTPKRILCFECSGHRERVEIRNRVAEVRSGIPAGPVLRQSPARHPLPTRGFTPDRDLARVQYKPGGRIEDQTLDWHCSNCDNRNFAKRSKCNKCQMPRSEVERKNTSSWGSTGSLDYISSYPREGNYNPREGNYNPREGNYRTEPRSLPPSFMQPPPPAERPEDRANDWKCSKCDNRNFAKRKECNRCKVPRDECEDKTVKYDNTIEPAPTLKRGAEPHLNHSKHMRSMSHETPRSEDLSKDWVCGKCNINCFAKKTSCFRCGKPRSEVENRSADVRQFESHAMVNYPVNPRSQPINLSGHNLTLRTNTFRQDPFRPGHVIEKTKKKWVDEDKSKDWNCKLCYINNFAKRKSCFQCKKDRSEVEALATGEETTEVAADVPADNAVVGTE